MSEKRDCTECYFDPLQCLIFYANLPKLYSVRCDEWFHRFTAETREMTSQKCSYCFSNGSTLHSKTSVKHKTNIKKLLSNRNTCESLGEFKHAVETLAYVSCSDSISGSPKLPPVLLQLDRNKVHMHFLFIS